MASVKEKQSLFVIVSHNTRGEIQDAIQSITNTGQDQLEYEIIVVDNNARDAIREHFPSATASRP